jgi:signal peptidase I
VVDSNCAERKFNEANPESGVQTEQACSIEDVNGTKSLRGELVSETAPPKDVKERVPRDSVWLVSDNRQYPYDSRDFGPVLREACSEKIFFRLVGAKGFVDADHRNQYIR